MKPRNLSNSLAQLNKGNLFLVLLYTCLIWLRYRVGSLRPLDILIPTVLAQVTLFILAVLISDNFIYVFAVGELMLLAIALLPLTLHRNVEIEV